jgi:hypothetical protein
VIENGWNGWQYENESDFSEKTGMFSWQRRNCRTMSRHAALTAERRYSSASFAQNVEQVYIDAARRRASALG